MTTTSTFIIPSDFRKKFPDENSCLHFLSTLKWKNGFVCPKCGHTHYCKGKRKYDRQCTKCKRISSPTSGTLFHMVKFSILKAFQIVYITNNSNRTITSTQLSKKLGLRQKTCWLFQRKIRETINNNRSRDTLHIISLNSENKKNIVQKETKIKERPEIELNEEKNVKKLKSKHTRTSVISFIKETYKRVKTKNASHNTNNQKLISFDLFLLKLINSTPLTYQEIRIKTHPTRFNSSA